MDVVKADTGTWECSKFIREWQAVHPITVDGNTYMIENRAGIFHLLTAQQYAKLYKTDSDGNEVVLYDAAYQLWSAVGLTLGGIVIFITILVSVILYQIKKYEKAQKNGGDRESAEM